MWFCETLIYKQRFISNIRGFQSLVDKSVAAPASAVLDASAIASAATSGAANATPTDNSISLLAEIDKMKEAVQKLKASSASTPKVLEAIDAFLKLADKHVAASIIQAAESCKKSVQMQCKAAIDAETVTPEHLVLSNTLSLSSLAASFHVSQQKRDEYTKIAQFATCVLNLVSSSVQCSTLPKSITEKTKEAAMKRSLDDYRRFKTLADEAKAAGHQELANALFAGMPGECAQLVEMLGNVSNCQPKLDSWTCCSHPIRAL